MKYLKLFESFTKEEFIEESPFYQMVKKDGLLTKQSGLNRYEFHFNKRNPEDTKKIYGGYKRDPNTEAISQQDEQYSNCLIITKLDMKDTSMVSDEGITRGQKSPYRAMVTEWDDKHKKHLAKDDFMIKQETIDDLLETCEKSDTLKKMMW